MPQELSWREAAIAVLQDADEPLSAQEIAQKIVDRKLRTVMGATPWATVGARIYDSMKNEGASSPFFLPEKGRFALRTKEQASAAVASTMQPQELTEAEAKNGKLQVKGVINALGMFWERSKVDWKGPQTRLLGAQTGGTQVDFSPQRGIYLLHDSQGVVYVGRVTGQNLGQRLWQHTFDRLGGRWNRFSWFGIFPVSEGGVLKIDADFSDVSIDSIVIAMEALLIEALEPRQNRKRGDTAFEPIEFLQSEDPNLEYRRKLAMIEEFKSTFLKGA